MVILWLTVLPAMSLTVSEKLLFGTYKPSNPSSAVERQEQQLHFKRHHAPAKRDNKEIDNPINETEAYEDYRQD